MLIDWFTVGAQAGNFLILVWLLKRFLYKPILAAVDTREKRIAAAIADAEAGKSLAQKERDEFRNKNEAFAAERAALFARAGEEAKAEGARLLAEARGAADALSAKRGETLKRDAANLHQAIVRRTRQEVFAVARKALADLAAVGLEERMAEVFIRRLGEMDGASKSVFAEGLRSASVATPVLVRSAFDLPAAPRAAIQQAVNGASAAEIPLRFEAAPDLVGGIELTANGQKVAWSISEYLASLEKSIVEVSDGAVA